MSLNPRFDCKIVKLLDTRACSLGVTVAILAQGTTSGDALCAALFYVPAVQTPVMSFILQEVITELDIVLGMRLR